MAFIAYATVEDIRSYVPTAIADLWEHDEDAARDTLRRAAKKINERLGGMERFTVVPVETEDDGSYAEVLIETNVYEALWLRVTGVYAGEAFEDHWAWLRLRRNELWKGIEEGTFSFGSEPEAAAGGGVAVHTKRASP